MRILFTIPHYFDPQGGGRYGSLKADPRPRRGALATAIAGLHATFGARQGLLLNPIASGNDAWRAEIEVVVCTTRGKHLLDGLGLPTWMYRHHATSAAPMLVGFECHAVLREALGRYDYYCYLEDDLLVNDVLFFQKLQWFTQLAGEDAVLQPNRFEVALGQPFDKLYIDGDLANPGFSHRLQDITDRPALEAELLGTRVAFRRLANTHSGCFFLNAAQMRAWAGRPEFLNRDTSFAGPLESAATLGITRFFRAYKPARENLGFLEVRHLDNRYLGVRVRAPRAPQRAARP